MKLHMLLVGIVLLLQCGISAQTDEFESLRAAWNAQQYAEVLPKLVAYWRKPGGQTWQVGFMIGTTQCRIPGKEALGAATLQEALNFPVIEEVRTIIAEELRVCSSQAERARPQVTPVAPVIVQITGGPRPRVSGKGGYMSVDRNTLPASQLAVSPVSVEDLKKRLLPVSQAQAAAAAGLQRLGLSGGAAVVGPFAVAVPYRSGAAATDVGRCLQNFEGALRRQFSMELPPRAVTVYALPEVEMVPQFSAKLHGTRLPDGTLAYSVYEDLSIIGPGGPGGCGSLAHELVHLMIRSHFGNSPPWIEEGLASEVAVAGIRDGRLGFGASWRDDMLRSQWSLRPTVAELIDQDWGGYAPSPRVTLQKAAATQAMAASFIRYLASRNKLEQIYFASQNDHFQVDSSSMRSYQEIVETSLERSLDQIDADFANWFGRPAAARATARTPPPNAPAPVPRQQGPQQQGPQQQAPRQ